MGKLFKLQCSRCEYKSTVREGSTRSLVNEYFTVFCDACSSIENLGYEFPENRSVRSEPVTVWWGCKKRQKELDDRYEEESALWGSKLVKLSEEALQQSCNQCGNEVRRVHFGDPFIEPIPLGIGCPSCKQFDCVTACLQGMYD